MKPRFNVAILGAGSIAGQMAIALKSISDEAYMYAVASRSKDKAKVFCKKWGFEKAFCGNLKQSLELIHLAKYFNDI